jgi:glycosyltransferase involved in cell wall biosynthesis
MKPKTILHILSKFGGDYQLFDDFLLRLDPSRFRNIVCFLRGKPENNTRLEQGGIETLYLDKEGNKGKGISPNKLFTLKRLVQEKEVDLIHSQRHKPTVYGVLTSLLVGGRPVISTVHGRDRTRSTKRRLANKFLFNRVARIIAVSSAVRFDILKTNSWLEEGKVVAVRNGLDYTRILEAASISRSHIRRKILPGHENDYWFGTAGRLSPVKNHVRLIKAFAGMAASQSYSVLLIAGSGPLEGELQAVIRELDLAGRVFLLGYRDDVPEFFRALDAFVFPSLSEGLGLAMLEAMASGLPMVVSQIDSCIEIMNGIDCGILVDPSDESDICRGMVELSGLSPTVLSQMGRRSRDRAVNDFSVDRMTGEISDIYDEVLIEFSGR